MDHERVLQAARDGIGSVIDSASLYLDEVDWQRQTPCSAWDATELVRHVHTIALDYVAWTISAIEDDVQPLRTGEALSSWNAVRLREVDHHDPEDHASRFRVAAEEHLWLATDRWDEPLLTHPGGAWTSGEHIGVAAIEWSVHAWDLGRTVSLDVAPIDPEVLADVWSVTVAPVLGEPLPPDEDDVWHALLRASGRDPEWRPASYVSDTWWAEWEARYGLEGRRQVERWAWRSVATYGDEHLPSAAACLVLADGDVGRLRTLLDESLKDWRDPIAALEARREGGGSA